MKMTNAMITKSSTDWMNAPYFTTAAPASSAAARLAKGSEPRLRNRFEKSTPPVNMTDDREYHVVDQGSDNLAEGTTNDDTDRHIHDVAPDCELLELLQQETLSFINVCRLILLRRFQTSSIAPRTWGMVPAAVEALDAIAPPKVTSRGSVDAVDANASAPRELRLS